MYQQVPEEYNNSNNYEQISQRDNGFMRWFLEVDAQIEDLKFQWSGWIKDFKTGEWKEPKQNEEYGIMNKQGVSWCYQFLKGFLGKANMSSSYNEEYVKFIMREYVSKSVFLGLENHYWDFGFKRGVDLETVGVQMCNLCLAILLGARANGYRMFLTQTHQVQELKTNQDQERKSLFSSIGGLFKRSQDPQQNYYMNGGN